MIFHALFALLAVADPAPANVPNLRCGCHCLFVSLRALDVEIASLAELEERLGQPGPGGYSMAQLDDAAHTYGAHTLGVETNAEDLLRRPGRFACIALIADNHFVNLANVDDGRAHVVDPPRASWIPLTTLRTQWDGRALLIAREPLLAEADLPWEFPAWLWPAVAGVLLAMATLFVSRRLWLRRRTA